jgi:plastocyanin
MTKWLAILISCLALGLVVAACGDDDDDDGGGGGGAAPAEEPAPSGGAKKEKQAAAGGKTVEVVMKDIAFDPNSITIKKGTTVKWTNEDSVGHDVTKTGGVGPDFSSGSAGGLNQGDTYEEKIKTPGEIEYVCTVHPNMTGTIKVTE